MLLLSPAQAILSFASVLAAGFGLGYAARAMISRWRRRWMVGMPYYVPPRHTPIAGDWTAAIAARHEWMRRRRDRGGGRARRFWPNGEPPAATGRAAAPR